MIKLLIIADDFTGAMDTGVQFTNRGAVTRVVTDISRDFSRGPADTQVLVINTESRHLGAEQAYDLVYRAAMYAVSAGVPYIYKKTDSALRGNLGSELAAVMDAAGSERLTFVPAFPENGRYTRRGVQYVGDLPVSESVFGREPFDPVFSSNIRELIGMQTDKPVISHLREEDPAQRASGIHVYDAESREDLCRIGAALGQGELHLAAGCAGFASVLADILDLNGPIREIPELNPNLFVVCGSMNPVTIRQIDEAEMLGLPRAHLTPSQKLDDRWMERPEGVALLRQWIGQTAHYGGFLLDVNGADEDGGAACADAEKDLDKDEARTRVANTVGVIIKKLLDMGLDATFFCTGGDTLYALLQAMAVEELVPHKELDAGVVLNSFVYGGKTRRIISKSGGFGDPDLLCRLTDTLKIHIRREPYAAKV